MAETVNTQNYLQIFDTYWGDPKIKPTINTIPIRPSLASVVGQKVKFFSDPIKVSQQNA